MIETAVIAKYVPFLVATGAGLKLDSASVMTAIATAVITAAGTMYATVSTLGVKMDNTNTTLNAVLADMKDLKKGMVDIQIDRASKIAESDARFKILQAQMARLQGYR